MISTIGHRFFERGQAATLVKWLTAIDAADPDAPAVVGVNLLAAQVAADQSDPAAETHRRLSRRPDLTPGERAAADALYTTHVVRGLAPEMVLTTADRVLDAMPSLEAADVVDFIGLGGLDSARLMAEYDAAVARFLLGDLAGAASGFEHVLTLPGLDYLPWKIYTQGSLALVRAWNGHCTEALQLADSAIRAARGIGIATHSSMIHAHMASALVHLDRTALELAGTSLAESDQENRRRTSTVVNFDLQRTLLARLTAVRQGPAEALALLRTPAASALEPPVLVHANRALEARLLVGLRDLVEARVVLERSPAVAELAAAHVDLALATGDLAVARRHLDHWDPQEHDLRARVGKHLRLAVVLDAEGNHAAALRALREAVAAADGERLRWPFLEVPSALRLLRRATVHRSFGSDSLEELALRLEPRGHAQKELVTPLTESELIVLEYLPQRMRNQDIADDLYVTVNTVKSHLRGIYRKLGATSRDEAVRRASELGML